MVRQCAVKGCLSKDTDVLSHRFPRDRAHAEKWRYALGLHSQSVDILTLKAVVCTKHFEVTAYRNINSSCLNKSAVPKLCPVRIRSNIAIERKVLNNSKWGQNEKTINHSKWAKPVVVDGPLLSIDDNGGIKEMDVVADPERTQLAGMSHDELIDEVIAGRRDIETLQKCLEGYRQFVTNIKREMEIAEHVLDPSPSS